MKHLNTSRHRGYLLMEMAIVLTLIAITLGPLMQLMRSQQTLSVEKEELNASKHIMEAVEAFVLSKRRLPCPSDTQGGDEHRANGRCLIVSGWVPARALSIPPNNTWQLTVATLASAGAPAADALTADNPFAHINPQQLAEIVYAPPSETKPVGNGPLPAIHMCQFNSSIQAPQISQAGCGQHPLHSASAVLVLSPAPSVQGASPLGALNQNRTLQFLIHPDLQTLNPLWLSFERLNWLWMQSGALGTI